MFRAVLIGLVALCAVAAQTTVPSFELDELTIQQLQDATAAGRYTSRRLVELYSARIAAILAKQSSA